MFFLPFSWVVANDHKVLACGGAMSYRDPALLNYYMEERCQMTETTHF